MNDNLKYLKYHKCYKCKWGSFVGDKFVCMFPRCVKRYKNKIRGEKSNGKEKIQQT